MTMDTRARRRFEQTGTVIMLVAACSLPLVAQTQKPAPPPLPTPAVTVSTPALQRLLPAVTGWTKERVTGNRVDLSETCAYSYATGIYTNGVKKVRITLADTAADPAALAVVAPLVATLADDYSVAIDGTTTIKRLKLNGAQAAMRWNTRTLDGEFVVVIDGRFVVFAEGTGVESIDVLQGLVEQVDLKALAALK